VQGCRAELEALLRVVAFDPGRDALHPAGDLVNRGPDSLGVLRLLRDVGAQGVLGNHDVHLLAVAAGQRPPRPGDTFHDVLDAPDAADLLAWLAAKPFVRAWDDVVLVHGGLHPHWRDPVAETAGLDPLAHDARAEFATHVRHCDAAGRRPLRDDPPPKPPYRPWWEHWLGPRRETRTLVWGHWARRGLVQGPRLRGLDTGCVWGHELTAWIAEEDRLVSVPAERRWANDEE
jgi:bis(5'-nucleosyl)-tetraphosphatase (symmetrical)